MKTTWRHAATVAAVPERFDLPTPFPVGGVNAYYVTGRVPTLVDTGTRTGPARRALEEALDGRPVDRVVVTHGHVDHFGLAALLKDATGAEIWAHQADAEVLADYDQVASERTERHAEGLRRAGVPSHDLERMRADAERFDAWGQRVDVDRRLRGEQTILMGDDEYDVLHAPGHTAGSILLRTRDSAHTFTGDTVLEHITPNALSVRPEDRDALPTYLETLRRLAQDDLGRILPGHGPPFDGHQEVIRRALRHAEIRQQRIVDTLDPDPQTAYEVARALFRRLPSDQLFLAVSEVLGHLNALRQAGRVASTRDDAVDRWHAAPPDEDGDA